MNSSANAKLSINGQWGAVSRRMTKLLDAAHFKTYFALACFADNETRQCYPSMRRLTEDTGSNRSTVNQHIKTLCAVGPSRSSKKAATGVMEITQQISTASMTTRLCWPPRA